MVATDSTYKITWELLPEDFVLDDEPVDNVNQPPLAAALDEHQRYWLAEMELFIGVWPGKRENRDGYWLRWWDQEGNLLLWGTELVEQERLAKETAQQQANQERLAKETALNRLQELEKRLRDAGIAD